MILCSCKPDFKSNSSSFSYIDTRDFNSLSISISIPEELDSDVDSLTFDFTYLITVRPDNHTLASYNVLYLECDYIENKYELFEKYPSYSNPYSYELEYYVRFLKIDDVKKVTFCLKYLDYKDYISFDICETQYLSKLLKKRSGGMGTKDNEIIYFNSQKELDDYPFEINESGKFIELNYGFFEKYSLVIFSVPMSSTKLDSKYIGSSVVDSIFYFQTNNIYDKDKWMTNDFFYAYTFFVSVLKIPCNSNIKRSFYNTWRSK